MSECRTQDEVEAVICMILTGKTELSCGQFLDLWYETSAWEKLGR